MHYLLYNILIYFLPCGFNNFLKPTSQVSLSLMFILFILLLLMLLYPFKNIFSLCSIALSFWNFFVQFYNHSLNPGFSFVDFFFFVKQSCGLQVLQSFCLKPPIFLWAILFHLFSDSYYFVISVPRFYYFLLISFSTKTHKILDYFLLISVQRVS